MQTFHIPINLRCMKLLLLLIFVTGCEKSLVYHGFVKLFEKLPTAVIWWPPIARKKCQHLWLRILRFVNQFRIAKGKSQAHIRQIRSPMVLLPTCLSNSLHRFPVYCASRNLRWFSSRDSFRALRRQRQEPTLPNFGIFENSLKKVTERDAKLTFSTWLSVRALFGPVSFQTILNGAFSLKQQLLTCQVAVLMRKWPETNPVINENTMLSP